NALDTLADLYEAQNDFAAAEPLLKRSVAIREKVKGQPGVGPARERLAVVYDKLGRSDEAQAVRNAGSAIVGAEDGSEAEAKTGADEGALARREAETTNSYAATRKPEEPAGGGAPAAQAPPAAAPDQDAMTAPAPPASSEDTVAR